MPIWLLTYSVDALQPDLVAGLTVAAYLLPAGIGDASLAGLLAEAGRESALLYFNVDCVRDRVLAHVDARREPTRLLALYLGTVPRIDLAGATFIADLRKRLAARGIMVQLAEPHGEVRAALRRFGCEREYGPLESGRTVDTIISEWRAANGATHAALA